MPLQWSPGVTTTGGASRATPCLPRPHSLLSRPLPPSLHSQPGLRCLPRREARADHCRASPNPSQTLNPQRQTLNGRFGGSKAAPAPGPPRKMGRGHEKKHPRARFGELENTRHLQKDAQLGNRKSLVTSWKALFLYFLEARTKNDKKRPTQMGSKMRPLCDSMALWRGAASVVSGRHHHRRRLHSSTMSL